MDGERSVDIEAMVDTGASYSVAPASLLEQLGVGRIDSIRLSLADGLARSAREWTESGQWTRRWWRRQPVSRRPLLEQLGGRQYQGADGRSVVYEIGRAIASIDGRRESTLVLFGDDDSRALLGAYTLEGLRLTVDPVHMRLVPLTSAWL